MTRKENTNTLSKNTEIILQILGNMIRVARIESKISQAELAERVGISRATVAAIEKGKPNVAIGTVFEAAMITGVPLMGSDEKQLPKISQTLSNLIEILPSKTHYKKIELDNDF